MTASNTLHDVIADIIAEVVDARPQAPDEVRPYTDRVLDVTSQFAGGVLASLVLAELDATTGADPSDPHIIAAKALEKARTEVHGRLRSGA